MDDADRLADALALIDALKAELRASGAATVEELRSVALEAVARLTGSAEADA